MDTYHGSHGESSGFESGAGLSIPLVLLSSPDGVPNDDTFFCHTFFVAGFVSIFLLRFQKFLKLDPPFRVPVVMHLDFIVKL